jgi:outer membrane biosynthesis protein TonB
MRLTAALSVIFHSAIILFAWLGTPSFSPLITPEQLIEVALVSEAPPPKPKPAPKPEPVVQPPPPPPPQVSEPEPQPEPEAVPLPQVKPKPKPKLAPKPKPKPKLKPKPKPKPKSQVRRPRPKSKPKPATKGNDFASVLKTVSKLKKIPPVKTQPKSKPKAKTKKPVPDFQKQIAEALKRKRKQAPRLGSAISTSELSATIRRQIEACWSLPAGARDASNMTVEIRIVMNPDGRARSAAIIDTRRANRDPFYRAMAESALRAVLNPRCQPLSLPLEKFNEWREIVLNFDPRDMY